MKVTTDILLDFFRDQGWDAASSATVRDSYDTVHLWHNECHPDPNCLYITDQADLLPAENAHMCLLSNETILPTPYAYHVQANCDLVTFFTAVQALFEKLSRWDAELSRVLLAGGTLQDILDCSASILRNPCMLEDDQFYVLASCGQVTQDDDPLFYETLKNGRAPNRLFERLLGMSELSRLPYTPRGSVTVARDLSKYTEILANCMVDGVPVIRFLMLCTVTEGDGLKDIVAHLMERIKYSAGIQNYSAGKFSGQDILFGRILENPNSPDAADAVIGLGLRHFSSYVVIGIDFGTQLTEKSLLINQLQTLFTGIKFFTYDQQVYAYVGLNGQNEPIPKTTTVSHHAIFNHLENVGAYYSMSNIFSDPLHLGEACSQALYALNLSGTAGNFDYLVGLSSAAKRRRMITYQEALPVHMLQTFFAEHEFSEFCPVEYLNLLQDDRKHGGNNLSLVYTYLANECNATTTSRLLHMHRNNVIYRISKIEEKYSVDFSDSRQRLLLQLMCIAAGYHLHQ